MCVCVCVFASGTSPESSPTKDSVEGAEDEAAKAAELAEKARKKDEEMRAKGACATHPQSHSVCARVCLWSTRKPRCTLAAIDDHC